MDKEAMMNNLQEHQYTGDGSFGLSAMYFAFGNPITCLLYTSDAADD